MCQGQNVLDTRAALWDWTGPEAPYDLYHEGRRKQELGFAETTATADIK